MTKKSMVIILIIVILAGAIAGAFVFLNQMDSFAPATRPSNGTGGTAIQQSILPESGLSDIGFAIPSRGVNLST